MVWWLASRIHDERTASDADKPFEELARDILFRRLYRRVLVVTRARNRAATRGWRNAEAVFGRIGQNWEQRRNVMIDLQGRVSRRVGAWDGSLQPGVSRLGPTAKEDFMAAADCKPLILIDYPPVKSGSTSQLDYLRENEWAEDGRADLRVDHLEESSMWTSLVEEYSAGLGKMRVYVHPEYAAVVQAAIGRASLEELLWGALSDQA
jgi:hypothetical protein